MSLEIRLLGSADVDLVTGAGADAFDSLPQEGLAAEFLADPRHHLVAAIDAGRIVGFVSALHYVHPDKPPELWINEVGVAPTHRGQGVGRAMLRAMLGHGRHLGCGSAWVLTDDANAAARRLYEASGGVRAEHACVMFEFSLSRTVDDAD
jgi:ribosomal protein S18 acetylase RimI-like enzyme